MNKQEKLIWNKLKNEYADNTEVLDVLCGGENAREKQIPKKPIEKENQYSEDYGYNSDILCPTCKAYIGYYTEAMCKPEHMQYCNECGQRIDDWRARMNKQEIEKAICVMEKQLTNGWIPVSERLPQLPDGKSFMPLNVTILAPSGLRNTVQMTWELKRGKPTWCYLGETSDWNVIAWQPLPEPYKGGI